MNPPVGDLTLPPGKVGFQRRPADEVMPGDGVVLDVADAALVLTLGACAVGCTGPRPKPPIAGEGVQPLVEADLTGGRIVVIDQRAGVVEQHLPRHPAKMAKRTLDPVEPGRLPLVPEGLHENPPRVAQGRDEQVDAHALTGDRGAHLAKIDLHLVTRRRLETHRRARLGTQFLAQMRHRPLHRAQADLDAVLAFEILAHDIGIAAVTTKPLGQPVPQSAQLLGPLRRPVAHPAFSRQIAPHRPAIAPYLCCYSSLSPTQRLQPQHRRDFVRRAHLIPPQPLQPLRYIYRFGHARHLLI